MAIASYIDPPALQAKADAKTLRKYQGTKSSIIAMPYKYLSREEIKARRNRQWMTEIAAVWRTYSSALKATWKLYAANIRRTGWNLFMQEYCYRKKYDLSYPPDPAELHQMYGLKISNSDGSGIVKAEHYNIAATGPIVISFNYKKVQREATGGLPFQVHAIAYYMNQGENKSDEYTFSAPAGNIDWVNEEFSFGVNGRYYFELIITFTLNLYNADIILDNFVVTDNIGVLVDEPWHVKAGKTWIYQVRTRKEGWEFSPSAGPPEFLVVYTGE